MHWHTRSTLLALLLLACASVLAHAEDTTHASPTFRSTVSEVRVIFFATDENNHPLTNLTRDDFAVVDNERVLRNFRSFTHSDETSLDVVVLLDLSESVAPRVRVAMSDVLQLIAQEQSIPEDNISVVSFGGSAGQGSAGQGLLGQGSPGQGSPGQGSPGQEYANQRTIGAITPALLCASGCRAAESMARLRTAKSGGATPLFDAIIFGADVVSRHRSAAAVRPVLILFSDGLDTFSLHSASDALRAVQNAGALIYAVDMGQPETRSTGSTFLRQVSDATGGRYFTLAPRFSQQDAAAVLNAALADLRASYVVTYDLPNHQTGFHSLRLLPTHNLSLTFHSRTGYDYEPTFDERRP